MFNQEMMRLGSQRSVIREISEFGQKRAREIGSQNVYNFSLGNPNVPAPQAVQEAILDIVRTQSPVSYHSYSTSAGSQETRQAVAEDLNQRFGTAFRAKDLFLTCGAAAALNIILKALLCAADEEVIVVAPYFPEYSAFVAAQGGRFVVVQPDPDTFQIDLANLSAAITPKTKAMLLNTPNNPSGVAASRETLAGLSELLTAKAQEFGHPIYLISDEPYRELVYGDTPELFPAAFYDNTIISYSWSKSLSLPGERIGYILVPECLQGAEELLHAVAGAARILGHVCAPSLFQQVIQLCIKVRPDIMVYQTNRDLLVENLSAWGYRLVPPQGAFYAFIASPSGDGEEFCQRAKRYDLLMVPGTGFGMPSHARLSYCVATATIQGSLPIFKQLMEEYQAEGLGQRSSR